MRERGEAQKSRPAAREIRYERASCIVPVAERYAASAAGRLISPLDRSRATVYDLLSQHIIPAIKGGRRWLVTRRAFEAWQQTCGKVVDVAKRRT